ncbi:MAG: phosphoribosyltransferase family protein [Acidimicrobiia bacterium]|nr:phosphoribosyltransferase family protein [Acidimicrobiia bacterium]
MPFRNRTEAGRRLAAELGRFKNSGAVVVGLPRGGVPVAAEVAAALDAPLDVLVVRKLGVPSQPELGMGAIGEDGVRVLSPDVISVARATERDIAAVEARERAELERRARLYRGDRPRLALDAKTVIIVDDGIATGGSALAAIGVAKAHGAERVILAVPVAPPETVEALGREADEVVCLETPPAFRAVGVWYDDFSATTDDEVVSLLARASASSRPTGPPTSGDKTPGAATPGAPAVPARDDDVLVQIGTGSLPGHLTVPEGARTVVVFAHGSGSSRHSPRNRAVAEDLNRHGLGTLLFDLLTDRESADRRNVFDIDLLGDRLVGATQWLRDLPGLEGVDIAYFGASTGAGAALWAAADPGSETSAVVSRGGRPDLAASRLPSVTAPTLLIVGGRDDVVIDLNRQAAELLAGECRLAIVPGATHLFEEPGALDQVTALARSWFLDH